MAAVAELEAGTISALAAAKRRGVKLRGDRGALDRSDAASNTARCGYTTGFWYDGRIPRRAPREEIMRTAGTGAPRSRHPFSTKSVVVHQEPLLPTDDRLNLPAGAGLQYRAATRWHVGSLSCSVGEDASHNYDSNETDNYAANAPFPVPRIIWVPDAIIVSVRHG
jgi:hypothetical protein